MGLKEYDLRTECNPRCMISNVRNLAHAIVVCLLFCVVPNYGQPDSVDNFQKDSLANEILLYAKLVKKAYGLDQTLLNGTRYYSVYDYQVSNPYFLPDSVSNRSLILNGQTYQDVRLKFDICAHRLELDYPKFSGGTGRIFTVADHVDGFSIDENHFEKLDFEKGIPKYYQVIRTNCFTCYVLWEGHVTGSTYSVSFSTVDKSLFLQVDVEILEFKRRGDFSEFFPEEYRKEIKRFLRKRSFKFSKATPAEIIENLNVVCKLLEDKETL